MVFFGKRSDAVKSKAGAKNNTAGRRGEKFSRTHPNCHRRRGGGVEEATIRRSHMERSSLVSCYRQSGALSLPPLLVISSPAGHAVSSL